MKAISKMVLAAVGAVFLAGCGGGGGSSSGGTAATGGGGGGSGGGGQATALAMVTQVAPQPAFAPAPQGTEESAAQTQREADNSFEPVARSPIKSYTPALQALSVGSLIPTSDYDVVFISQVEGYEILFRLYDSSGEQVLRRSRSSVSCTGGICNSLFAVSQEESERRFWDPVYENVEDRLEDQERYDDETGIFLANRQEYVSAVDAAAAAEGFDGVEFTHQHLGFEYYRNFGSSTNQIHTDALGRVYPVITDEDDDDGSEECPGRCFQDDWDVALFSKRDPTAADRLDHMEFGVWAVSDDTTGDDEDDLRLVGGLAFGVETPADAIPTTGTATYNGLVAGLVGPRTGEAGVGLRGVSGDVSVVVDFASDASDAVTATFSSMHSSAAATAATPTSTAWHNFGFAGTLNAGDRAQYTANTITVANSGATIAAGVDLLDNLATGQSVPTGSLQGRFYGPAPADGSDSETGGRWTVGDNNTIAVGSFGAKRQ